MHIRKWNCQINWSLRQFCGHAIINCCTLHVESYHSCQLGFFNAKFNEFGFLSRPLASTILFGFLALLSFEFSFFSEAIGLNSFCLSLLSICAKFSVFRRKSRLESSLVAASGSTKIFGVDLTKGRLTDAIISLQQPWVNYSPLTRSGRRDVFQQGPGSNFHVNDTQTSRLDHFTAEAGRLVYTPIDTKEVFFQDLSKLFTTTVKPA